jgi:hypothetical protein
VADLARSARPDTSDSRVIARMRKLVRQRADPARRRTRALTSATWGLLRRLRALGRGLLVRLGQWTRVIRRVRFD